MTNDRLNLVAEEASALAQRYPDVVVRRSGACRMRRPVEMSKRRDRLPSKAPLNYWIDATGLSTLLDRPDLRLSG
jgi:hypothetical protein